MLAIMAGFVFAVRTADVSAGEHPVIIAGARRQQLAAAGAAQAVKTEPTLWAQVSGLITLTPYAVGPSRGLPLHGRGLTALVFTAVVFTTAAAVAMALDASTVATVIAMASALSASMPTLSSLSAAVPSIMGIHREHTLPSWARIEGGYLYIHGAHNVLRIPVLWQEEMYYHRYIAQEDCVLNMDDPSTFKEVEVKIKGQKARIAKLFEELDSGDFRAAMRTVASLTHRLYEPMNFEVWRYEKEDSSYFLQQYAHRFTPTRRVEYYRRQCVAAGLDHKMAKLTADSEDDVRAALDAFANDEVSDNISGLAIKEDKGMARAFKEQVIMDKAEEGYVLLGGSPDSGLLLFVESGEISRLNGAEASQRAAKILLRGGEPLSPVRKDGQVPTIKATLVDYESGEFGARDGVFLTISRELISEIARATGIPVAFSYQGHYVEIGVSLMKGMVYVVGPDCASDDFKKLLASVDTAAAVDVNIYNKVTDSGHRAGDVVDIHPQMLWIMEADVNNPLRWVRNSAQIIERAGEKIAQWLEDKMTQGIASFVYDVETGEFAEHVSPFTRIGKLMKRGLPAFLSDKIEVMRALAKTAALHARKGVKIRGGDARLFMDDTLSVDTTDDGKQIPGARVPKQWGLEVGDHFIFVAYPVLPARDKEDRNPTIFVCAVEEVHMSPHIYVHGDVAEMALRDEDGDKPIIIVPEKGDDPLPLVGQANIDLSVRLSAQEAAKQKAAAEKQATYKANVGDGVDLVTRGDRVFQVFMRLGSQVGIVDDRVSSVMLYLGDRVHTVDTPTDEHALVFLAKCIQHSIENMKHVVDDRYSYAALKAWTKEVLPEAYDTSGDYPKFMKHPAVAVRKPGSGETTMIQHLKAIKALKAAVESGRVHTLGRWAEQVDYLFTTLSYQTVETDDGDFVVPAVDESLLLTDEAYDDACGVFYEAALSLFEEKEVFVACTKLGEEIISLARDAGKRAGVKVEKEKFGLAHWQAYTKYLRTAGAALRFKLLPAERLAVDMLWLHASAKDAIGAKKAEAVLHAGSPQILSLVSKVVADGLTAEDIKAELGIDGRNRITGAIIGKLEQYELAKKHAASQGGVVVTLDKGKTLPVNTAVRVGGGGRNTNIARITRVDTGEKLYLTDKSKKEVTEENSDLLLNAAEYRVVKADGSTLELA